MLGYDVEEVEGTARIPRRSLMIGRLPSTSFDKEVECRTGVLSGTAVVFVVIGKNLIAIESEEFVQPTGGLVSYHTLS